jgi:hypothetical protein
LNYVPETNLRAPQRFKPCSKITKMKMSRPSVKAGRKNSHPQINKIEASKTARTIDPRTTIGKTIHNNGDQALTTTPVQAATLIETRRHASSAKTWATDRKIAVRESTPTNPVWI